MTKKGYFAAITLWTVVHELASLTDLCHPRKKRSLGSLD